MRRVVPLLLLVAGLARDASAHRLDEYLQATLISIASNRVELEISMTPGVAVLPVVLAMIDKDGDGLISLEEQHGYAERLLRDLSLESNGQTAPLTVLETHFPDLDEMKTGLGTIRIRLRAERRGGHEIHFVNHHLAGISVYLVNCLTGNGLTVRQQTRDYLQSETRIEYSLASDSPKWAPGAMMFTFALLLFGALRRFSGSGRISRDSTPSRKTRSQLRVKSHQRAPLQPQSQQTD